MDSDVFTFSLVADYVKRVTNIDIGKELLGINLTPCLKNSETLEDIYSNFVKSLRNDTRPVVSDLSSEYSSNIDDVQGHCPNDLIRNVDECSSNNFSDNEQGHCPINDARSVVSDLSSESSRKHELEQVLTYKL